MEAAVIFIGPETVEFNGEQIPVPLVKVGGLTLLRRALRLFHRAGCTRILLLAHDGESIPSLKAEAEGDPRLKAELTVLQHHHPSNEATAALLEHRAGLPERFWLLSADALLSAGLFPRQVQQLPEGVNAAITVEGERRGLFNIWRNTLNVIQPGTKQGRPLEDLPARVAGDDDAEPGVSRERGSFVQVPADPSAPYQRVTRERDIPVAVRALVRSLRKPLARSGDGLVAYFINRPVSLFFSERLVNSPVTPNMVTTVGLLLGLAGAYLVSSGQYMHLVLAGLALQLSSVVDGIDGELARMRLTFSRGGEWFDTVCDDIVNISFLVGLGFGAGSRTGLSWMPVAGLAGGGVMLVTVLLLYGSLIRSGVASHNSFAWGFEAAQGTGGEAHIQSRWAGLSALIRAMRGLATKGAVFFSWVGKRDFYTFLLLLLVLDLPVVAFLVMLAGGVLISSGSAVQLLSQALKARRSSLSGVPASGR